MNKNPYKKEKLPSGLLIITLLRSLEHLWLDTHINTLNEKCREEFSLLRPHICVFKKYEAPPVLEQSYESESEQNQITMQDHQLQTNQRGDVLLVQTPGKIQINSFSGACSASCWSPSQDLLAIGGNMKKIIIFERAPFDNQVTSSQIMTLKNNICLNVSESLHETKVQANIWTPNGEHLISCGANGYLRIFDSKASNLKSMVKTREAINYLKANNTYIIGGHQSRVSITIWSQDDLSVIFALCLAGGRILTSLSLHGEEHFVFSTDRGELAKYRVGELKPTSNVELGQSVITLSEIEPSTQLILASGDTKGSLKFWSTRNLAMRFKVPNYASTLSHLVWRPAMDFSQRGVGNEFAIVTCAERNSIQFWDINIEGIAASTRLPQLTLAAQPQMISFHPDGTYLAIAYENAVTLLQLVNLSRRDIIAETTITLMEWSSQSHLLLIGMGDTVAIVDVETILLPASATQPVSSVHTPQLSANAQ